MLIDENIRELRKRLGMSQSNLAEKANLNKITINTAEQGKHLALNYLFKITEALGLEPGDLFLTEKDRETI